MIRRGPGLLGTMARTAVVAGTATAVSGGVMRRQRARSQQAAEAAAYQQQQQEAEMQAQMQQYAQQAHSASRWCGPRRAQPVARTSSPRSRSWPTSGRRRVVRRGVRCRQGEAARRLSPPRRLRDLGQNDGTEARKSSKISEPCRQISRQKVAQGGATSYAARRSMR